MTLPVSYTPLSQDTLEVDQSFGPIEFHVGTGTDQKSKRLLRQSLVSGSSGHYSGLLPSDIWGAARVLSQHFGRLNEIIIVKSAWELHAPAFAGDTLTATTTVKKKFKGRLATIKTTTLRGQEPILTALDTMLLLHDTDFTYKDTLRKPSVEEPSYRSVRKLYFRHKWDEAIWVKNIHTTYAQKYGFEKGLPEFVTYMNWIAVATNKLPLVIDVRRIYPMYKDDLITILTDSSKISFVDKFGNERLFALYK